MAVFDSTRRILIVDNDNGSARQIEQYLRAMGHDVVETVKSADEAIAAATLHKPDLIIMEVNTGPRDGIEAAKEIYSKLGIRCLQPLPAKSTEPLGPELQLLSRLAG